VQGNEIPNGIEVIIAECMKPQGSPEAIGVLCALGAIPKGMTAQSATVIREQFFRRATQSETKAPLSVSVFIGASSHIHSLS
jgi:hypothetical protein